MHVSRGMFGYQIFARIKPRPTVAYLLDAAHGNPTAKCASWNPCRSS